MWNNDPKINRNTTDPVVDFLKEALKRQDDAMWKVINDMLDATETQEVNENV